MCREKVIFNYNKLKGKITEVFGSQHAFANAMGMDDASLSARLNGKLNFTQVEMFNACDLLGISYSDMAAYFFTAVVEKSQHNETASQVAV